ncbi:MAG: alkaline phosphatase family protein [Oscillospiraceae bacterium]|jgi:hypothetical protein|nr:alkaline phosphatase family protein [Oscillospiraceae bacterium]
MGVSFLVWFTQIFVKLPRIFPVLESIAVVIIMLFSPGHTDGQIISPKKYLDSLDNSGQFVNKTVDSLPQTKAYDIIKAHLNAPVVDGKVKKVLFVGFDGGMASGILLTEGKTDSALQYLRGTEGGIYNAFAGGQAPYYQSPISGPGWATLLTGKWANGPGGHGVNTNGDTIAASGGPESILHEVARKGGSVAAYANWSGLFSGDDSVFHYEVLDAAAKGYNISFNSLGDDNLVLSGAKANINSASAADLIFLQLDDCDHAGHNDGFGNHSPEYVEAFTSRDQKTLELFKAVEARATYAQEDWLFIMSSDHGGISTAHDTHYTAVRQIYIATNKAF